MPRNEIHPKGAHRRGTPTEVQAEDAPALGKLILSLVNDLIVLVEQELQLFKTTMWAKATHALYSLSWIGVGGLLGYAGLMALVIAAVLGVGNFLPLWGAALVISLLVFIGSVILLLIGREEFRQLRLPPDGPHASAQENASKEDPMRKPAQGLDAAHRGAAPASGKRQTALDSPVKAGKKGSSWQVLKTTVTEWMAGDTSQMAATLAFYTAISIAPLLVLVVIVTGFFLGQQTAQGRLLMQLRVAVGREGAQFLEMIIEQAEQPTLASLAGIVSFGALLWGSTHVFSQLHTSLNRIWNVEPKAGYGLWWTIRNRLLSFTLVLGVAFLLLISLVVSAILSSLMNWGRELLPGVDWLWQGVNISIGFLVATLLFAAIYKVLPDAEVAWRDVWLGAAVTSALFTLGKFILDLYLGNTDTAYGVVGTLVVFLLWVYYSAQIFFIGAKFTQIYASYYGAGIEPAAGALHAE